VRAADQELLTRWIQQGSMSSGMQDQDACAGGDASAKASIWNSPLAEQAWRTYARLHTRLLPYFDALADEASATGAPVVRHLFLEHPDRPELRAVDDAYYLGPALLVAPVLVRGARAKTLTLPPGTYADWDSREIVAGGRDVSLDAPLTKLPLLLRAGHLVPLLDASIDTLADTGAGAGVVRARDVADVFDVVGLLAIDAPAASFRLADGSVLTAEADSSALAVGGAIRVEAAAGQTATMSGVTMRNGSPRRVRWDLVVAAP
jgi:alpha-glucosidase (family GH31 glycosyl hydrolase)